MGTVIFFDEKTDWGSNDSVHRFVYDWFNIDQYHYYDMSYLSGEKQWRRGPQREQFTEVRWWMQDNLNGEVVVKYDDRRSSGLGVTINLYFQHEADMMAFKLRWEE